MNWYKHDIAEWAHETEGLDDGAFRVYHVIRGLIYQNEGPIPLNEHGLAGRCKQHILKLRKNIATLIELKKLTLVDGKLSNAQTETHIESMANHRATSAQGGRGSAGVAKRLPRGCEEVAHRLPIGSAPNLLKTNGTATVLLLDTEHHKTRLEKTREEKKESCRVSDETPTKPPTKIYSDEFETNFWKPYPRTAIMSKKEAWREWMKLAPEQRQAACQAIEPYRKHLKQNPTLNAVHACRFLSQQRFDGILEKAAEQPKIDIRGHFV